MLAVCTRPHAIGDHIGFSLVQLSEELHDNKNLHLWIYPASINNSRCQVLTKVKCNFKNVIFPVILVTWLSVVIFWHVFIAFLFYYKMSPNNVFGSLMPFSPIEFFWHPLLYCLCPLKSFIFIEGKYHLPIVIYTYSNGKELIR